MTSEHLIGAVLVLFLLYGLVSGPLGRTVAPAPLVFAFVGLAIGSAGLAVIAIAPGAQWLLLFAEATLALVLFADASRLSPRKLWAEHRLAQRMLLIGLPLAILLGAIAAKLVFPALSWAEAALLGALLAPTDAALGLPVVENDDVPERIRDTIVVESGLNDGLSVPAVLLFAALAGLVSIGGEGWDFWTGFAARQIGLGLAIGVALGAAGGWAISRAHNSGLLDGRYETLACIGVVGAAFVGAQLSGGNAFVACFVAGIAFAATSLEPTGAVAKFVEQEGRFFSLTMFFVFGLALAPTALGAFDWRYLGYAALSLTAIRIGAVALSLLGTGLRWPTIAFLGWFGPRGLATIVFVLIIHSQGTLSETVSATAFVAVLLSILLHGVTAAPLARLYAHSAAARADGET